MTEGAFISDWRQSFQTIRNWVYRVTKQPVRHWDGLTWRRLADLYRLSNPADETEFGVLHELVAKKKCVPDRNVLIKIGDWKAPRNKANLGRNRSPTTQKSTSDALSMIRRDPSIESSIAATRVLWNGLYGIGIPMASTIFTLYDPVNFGVIDTFAWQCLFRESDVTINSFRQWSTYLTAVRRLAGRHGLRCRDVDAALWFVGTMES